MSEHRGGLFMSVRLVLVAALLFVELPLFTLELI